MASRVLRQIPLGDLQRGMAKVGGYLWLTPSDLREKLGIEFESADGDLGPMEVAALKLPNGDQVGLFRYFNSPKKEYTAVVINECSPDVTKAMNDVMYALQLEPSDFISISPEFKDHEYRVCRQDEHGNAFEVARFGSWVNAIFEMERLQNLGHKQAYWIEPTST